MQISEANVRFLTLFVVESDAIERLTNEPKVVERQLREFTWQGHAGALLWLYELAVLDRSFLTPGMVKKVQRLVVQHQHQKGPARQLSKHERGQWRQCEVDVAGRPGEPWRRVPEAMDEFLAQAEDFQRTSATLAPTDQVRRIAQLHWRYERIRPFVDGNGRSGRALVLYWYWWMGLPPFLFTAPDRGYTYFTCFDDVARMEEYFLARSPFPAVP